MDYFVAGDVMCNAQPSHERPDPAEQRRQYELDLRDQMEAKRRQEEETKRREQEEEVVSFLYYVYFYMPVVVTINNSFCRQMQNEY